MLFRSVQADILKIVQATEDRYFCEFAHSGEEGKAQILVILLYFSVEVTHSIANEQSLRDILNIIQNRLVILIIRMTTFW